MASGSISAQVSAPAVAVSQPVSAPLTNTAIFLVVTVNPGEASRALVLSLCAALSGLLRAVGFRVPEGTLSCVMGFGSKAWDRLFGSPRPAELHPFQEIRSGPRHAVSTAGDLIFHIRAKRMDLCFELATQIMARLEDAVTTADEVQGFRYFDERDLLGFVDGTENPTGGAALEASSLATKILPSPAEVTSSSKSICTISMPGTSSPPRLRKKSSAAPKWRILNSMSRSNPPRRITPSP